MKFKPDSFYLVRWHDAAEKSDQDDEEFGALMETTGWIVKSNRYGIRIANERYVPYKGETKGNDGQYRGLTDIPRKIIMSAREVDLYG